VSAPATLAVLRHARIVEVGPRDGFQSVAGFISTTEKLRMIERLYEAGLKRMEVTAFVSDKAVPQLADAAALLAAVNDWDDMDAQVLVPNLRHARRALDAGARHLAYVVSVSERHNRGNVNRSPSESVGEYAQITTALSPAVKVRLNIGTAFHCPFEGWVAPAATLALIANAVRAHTKVEIALCDTTGHATPDRVAALFSQAQREFPEVTGWAFHGHDTYGLGVANVLAAYASGVTTFDACFAGLGGCPFAPGATGNVATEDVVWTLSNMGIETGIDLDKLLTVAASAEGIPGAQVGGRVRVAQMAARERC
jgi:hydroxymethylglutaryl-CoA lyase